MQVRTVLYPMGGQDVTVLQYSTDGVSFKTMPVVSSNDLTDEQMQEINDVLGANEEIVQKYYNLKLEALHTKARIVESVPSELNKDSTESSPVVEGNDAQ